MLGLDEIGAYLRARNRLLGRLRERSNRRGNNEGDSDGSNSNFMVTQLSGRCVQDHTQTRARIACIV